MSSARKLGNGGNPSIIRNYMKDSSNNCDIAVFVAHCDDAEVWAGGIISKTCSQEGIVDVYIANHDNVRRKEAEKSAAELGYKTHFRPEKLPLREWAKQGLHGSRPEVLLTHPANDPHLEHREVWLAVEWALKDSKNRRKYPLRWYSFDTYYLTLSRDEFPILIDITDSLEAKCRAIACHQSQNTEELIAMVQASNVLHGMKVRTKYAEAFYPFALLGRWPQLREAV